MPGARIYPLNPSANSTQRSRDSRDSRACGAPDYLAALGACIDIESGALSTLECLEPTEMAASLEYVYLTWSIRSDICSDMAQYYIWVEMTSSNYKDYLLLIRCSTHHLINRPSWHWMDPFPHHWLSSTLSCLEWKVSTCKSPVIQASQSFGAKRFA